MTADFLFEIGVEELPTPYIPPALAQLDGDLREELGALRLSFSDCAAFATPRRLTVLVKDLSVRQQDYQEEATGPPVSAAYDKDGLPTKALTGFVKGRGVDLAAVRRVRTAKGEYVAVTLERPGRGAAELLPEACARLVAGLAFPRSMRWRSGDFRFARPIRWLVALLGEHVLELEIAGLRASRASRGHRFLHPGPVTVPHPTRYVEALAAAHVVVDPRLRQEVLAEQVDRLARQAGGRVVAGPEYRELLEINNYLVERPEALLGRFDEAYLDLPREVIVTALREHQRYFAVEREDGTLLPVFVGVRIGDDRGMEGVIAGNEAVLRARLADARFYWETDLKRAPAARAADLAQIVWLEGMGTVRDKSERVARLAAAVARTWDESLVPVVERAALLAKTDLLSEMIGSGKEYASLEGVMGAYYAERHGEPAAVCAAIRDHVRPRSASDPLPDTLAGAALAVADRVDTVAGCFLADKVPTGSEDPYGVRRAGNGAVRILLGPPERHLDLAGLSAEAVRLYPNAGKTGKQPVGGPIDPVAAMNRFWKDRVEWALLPSGYAYDEIAASVESAAGWADPVDAERRTAALKNRRANDDFKPLIIGYKRVANILRAAPDVPALGAAPGPFEDPAEAALAAAVEKARAESAPLVAARDYDALLGVLLRLRAPIDAFFEAVMVNVEDAEVRARRLGLLAATRALFDRAWDLSRVVVEG